MSQNEHVYAIYCWLEIDDNVISGPNIKTIKSYIEENFEVASSSSFWDFPKRLFCDGKVCDSSGGVNAICYWLEVADDVIASEDAETLQ